MVVMKVSTSRRGKQQDFSSQIHNQSAGLKGSKITSTPLETLFWLKNRERLFREPGTSIARFLIRPIQTTYISGHDHFFRNFLSNAVSFQVISVADFVGRLNLQYWNVSPWTLGEEGSLRVNHPVKKKMQILGTATSSSNS